MGSTSTMMKWGFQSEEGDFTTARDQGVGTAGVNLTFSPWKIHRTQVSSSCQRNDVS
jgi:hypothetical protein